MKTKRKYMGNLFDGWSLEEFEALEKRLGIKKESEQ